MNYGFNFLQGAKLHKISEIYNIETKNNRNFRRFSFFCVIL